MATQRVAGLPGGRTVCDSCRSSRYRRRIVSTPLRNRFRRNATLSQRDYKRLLRSRFSHVGSSATVEQSGREPLNVGIDF